MSIDEIIFYLKSMYSTHNEELRTFIDDIPTNDSSFEAMTNRLKTFSKCIKDDENIGSIYMFYLVIDFNGIKII